MARSDGTVVLFGQRRISGRFSSDPRVPAHLRDREISEVAADLRAGKIKPSDLPVGVYAGPNGELITINNKTLAALSDAGLKPTNVTKVQPTVDELARLAEKPIINSPIPGPSVPITPSQQNLKVIRVITVPR